MLAMVVAGSEGVENLEGQGGNADGIAFRLEITRGDIAIAAIVARPAQDQRRPWSDIEPHGFRQRPARPLHQLGFGRARCDGLRFGFAHCCGGEDRANHGSRP